MRIYILGWASLITAPGCLRLASPFQPGGPELPLEFSHVALDKRLTVIIDETNGVPCPTQFAVSSYPNLYHAIADLRAREKLSYANRVGWILCGEFRWNHRLDYTYADAHLTIGAWGSQQPECDAVIWTASSSNFHYKDKADEPFCAEAVQRYLRTLNRRQRVLARAYAQNVPSGVQTPARTIIES